MKFKSYFLAVLSFALFALSCDKSDGPQPSPSGLQFSCADSPTTCELTSANGLFAIDVFKKINADEPDGNIFISPFSISTALTMTTNGAVGQTSDEMRNTLRINDMDMPSVNGSYQQLLDVLPALDPATKLKLANSIWPKIGYPVLESFLSTNTEYFNSEVLPVDFTDPATLGLVNGWIEENTDGLIKDALVELPPDVVMLLINAIYFKGSWQTEFNPEDTHRADFYTADDTVQVDMMHLEEQAFPYFENGLFQAIDLPYGDSIFSMSIFLPKEGHQVSEVIDELNGENWDTWTNSFAPENVQLFMPKFKMEYGIKMRETLSALGMPTAFTTAADFSKMIDGGGVMIDNVIHKAFIEVDEEGSEAGAVTVVVIIETSIPLIPTVNVNRPFLFVIRDNQTNSILFMGKMMDPEGG